MPGDPEVLISQRQIDDRLSELARDIDRDYAECDGLVMIGVLKGAFIFLADLSRRLTVPRRIEFIALASYGAGGSVSSGAVRLVMDTRATIENQDVLVVEDIVDTGRTLHYLIDLLGTRQPRSIRTCALVRKRERSEVDVTVDYLGFDIPDVWVVGYGLDYAERYRTLPYIAVVNPAGEGVDSSG